MGLPVDKKEEFAMVRWDSWAYLNVRRKERVEWEEFPSDFEELSSAMGDIPTVAPHTAAVWRILAAILHLGNATFKGSGAQD